MELLEQLVAKNGLVVAFLLVGLAILLAQGISKYVFRGKIPAVALAILGALGLAFLGGKKGLADFPLLTGLAVLGGSMFRDFAVVATAMGADMNHIKKAGKAGILSLFLGVTVSFIAGVAAAMVLGYTDPVDLATIGAGACTYIVGPVTGAALGAASEVLAISIAAGVVKTILVTILTPLIAKQIGLNNPHSAMVFGGFGGTTSGVVAGLAATDPKLVPYGALTATFYTGLGCLLCPSVFYLLLRWMVGG